MTDEERGAPDDMPAGQRWLLARAAGRAFPTVLPPPTPDLVRHQLEVLKSAVAHGGRCGGPLEADDGAVL